MLRVVDIPEGHCPVFTSTDNEGIVPFKGENSVFVSFEETSKTFVSIKVPNKQRSVIRGRYCYIVLINFYF